MQEFASRTFQKMHIDELNPQPPGTCTRTGPRLLPGHDRSGRNPGPRGSVEVEWKNGISRARHHLGRAEPNRQAADTVPSWKYSEIRAGSILPKQDIVSGIWNLVSSLATQIAWWVLDRNAIGRSQSSARKMNTPTPALRDRSVSYHARSVNVQLLYGEASLEFATTRLNAARQNRGWASLPHSLTSAGRW